MPSPRKILSLHTARRLIGECCFDHQNSRVGLEVEWFPIDRSSPLSRPSGLGDLLAGLPQGSSLSFEPGGQVEISTLVQADCESACNAAALDSEEIARVLDERGIGLMADALDVTRACERVLDEPRYALMEDFFSHFAPYGKRMMSATGAVHVNVSAGPNFDHRFELAHRIGPLLTAAFANSPFVDGRPSGWQSSRMQCWLSLDPTRTAPVFGSGWADYALKANLMLIRAVSGWTGLAPGFTLADWIEKGHPAGYPTPEDLDYHLTTLFPPVRPRGWLELRMIDMVPDWRAAAAFAVALMDDEETADRVFEVSAPVCNQWGRAARDGLNDPEIAAITRECFAAALKGMDRINAGPINIDAAEGYFDRYIARGETPASERLSQWTKTGEVQIRERFT